MADDLTCLLSLSDNDLRNLSAALRSGRLNSPFQSVALRRFASSILADGLALELQAFHEQGFNAIQISFILDTLLKDRSRRPHPEDAFELVTTGPDAGGTGNRDTSVVVRELFAQADKSVLVAGYAVYQGQRVFEALADRMHANPHLTVRMFLDVRRGPGDTSAPSEIIRRFWRNFCANDWPADRPFPKVFYLSSSLEEHSELRAALHAKCVVVDGLRVFISSANFTEAAQRKNLEIGLLIRSKPLADQITGVFDDMVESGALQVVFSGLGDRAL